MRQSRMTAVYSIAHFAVDFSCACLVVRFVSPDLNKFDLLLLYNFCAFALQMPLGVLTDIWGNGRLFSAVGCLMIAVSSLLGAYPVCICVLAGTGNALFHIGGGHDILSVNKEKAAPLGLFVSPGALGLFAGTLMSRSADAVWLTTLFMCICTVTVTVCCPRIAAVRRRSIRNRTPYGFIVPALLFLAVCLRSFGGFLFVFDWKSGIWSWVFVLCIVFGKIAGGLLYDFMGPLKTAAISLLSGALLFFFSGIPVPGCAAVLLFNMTMPVTLRGAANAVHDMPGFTFGLLTMALFIGFIPVYADCSVPVHPLFCAALCLITLVLLIPAFQRRWT